MRRKQTKKGRKKSRKKCKGGMKGGMDPQDFKEFANISRDALSDNLVVIIGNSKDGDFYIFDKEDDLKKQQLYKADKRQYLRSRDDGKTPRGYDEKDYGDGIKGKRLPMPHIHVINNPRDHNFKFCRTISGNTTNDNSSIGICLTSNITRHDHSCFTLLLPKYANTLAWDGFDKLSIYFAEILETGKIPMKHPSLETTSECPSIQSSSNMSSKFLSSALSMPSSNSRRGRSPGRRNLSPRRSHSRSRSRSRNHSELHGGKRKKTKKKKRKK